MDAILVISHGSHSPKTKQEVIALCQKLKTKLDPAIVEYAFLEIDKPSIPDGINHCLQKGATHVTVLLNFLNAGKHVDQDIPRIIKEAQRRYPNVTFHTTIPVGQHSKIPELFMDLLKHK